MKLKSVNLTYKQRVGPNSAYSTIEKLYSKSTLNTVWDNLAHRKFFEIFHIGIYENVYRDTENAP